MYVGEDPAGWGVAKYTDKVVVGDTWQGKEMLYLNTEGIRGGRGHIGVAHRTI